jgi:hypothetical protein
LNDDAPDNLASELRTALTWHLPPAGWTLLDGLTKQIEPALHTGDQDQLQLAAQRISLLKPGNAIPANPARAQPCPPGLRQHIETLIQPTAAAATHRER